MQKFCKEQWPVRNFSEWLLSIPIFYPEDYYEEARRCVQDLGFVALKITPIAHACHPSSKDAYYVYEVCRELKVPLMIHTGNGIPFADPTACTREQKIIRMFP